MGGFLYTVYPEPSVVAEARHRTQFSSWVDLAFTILYTFFVLLLITEPYAWLALFQVFHLWTWAIGIGVSEARDGAFILSFGFGMFVVNAVLDAIAIVTRFVIAFATDDATPWIQILLLFMTILLFATSLFLLVSANTVRAGLRLRDEQARTKYERLEFLASIGRGALEPHDDESTRVLVTQERAAEAKLREFDESRELVAAM